MAEANTWGVAFDVTDEQIKEELAHWDWGWSESTLREFVDDLSVSAAMLVFDAIRRDTMASISSDGTIELGLFEFDMPLKVGLTELVEDWAEGRHTDETQRLADLLEALAARLRGLSEDSA